MAITTLNNVKNSLGIALSDTTKDAQINTLITQIEGQYLNIRNKAFDVVSGSIVYPSGSEYTAIQMISYTMKNINSAGVSSESLGNYSVSFEKGEVIGGYPKSITFSIKKYMTAV